MKNQKTPEQLRREIRYFEAQAARTTSRDRMLRAEKAIADRQKELAEALNRKRAGL
jgi:hypothetical protein